MAAEVYPWRATAREDDETSYWVTGQAAANVLGVNRPSLGQLADADQPPFVRHRNDTRLHRQEQLAIIAYARAASRLPVSGCASASGG